MTPAKVRYIGSASKRRKSFTAGNLYDAFFVEYWEGVRNSLHVRNDEEEIVDFVPLEAFEIISDPDGLLEMREARVRCVTRRFEDCWYGVHFGREYAAIGRDRDGFYLVKDETECCYFYPPTAFEINSDPEGILGRRSVYYNYFGSRSG